MSRAITQADLDGFAAVSGDDNPIHTDAEYAARTPFALPVAHGMFLFSLVRAELTRRWPDLRITDVALMFPTSTPVGSEVTIELAPVDESRDLVRVEAGVRKQDGDLGLRGTVELARRSAS